MIKAHSYGVITGCKLYTQDGGKVSLLKIFEILIMNMNAMLERSYVGEIFTCMFIYQINNSSPAFCGCVVTH
jgi:hypothetical protein